ncbi:MAG: 3-hydroxylacyl-ACP dehydratase [Casimicrobiaceae bacterium]
MNPDACDIRRLVPHQGTMCLLDSVEFWDASRIVCTTGQHRLAGNPLAVDGRLSAVNAIEFAAQAMAVHGALEALRRNGPALGMLLSVRNCLLHCDRLDQVPGILQVKAGKVAGNQLMLMYDFGLFAGEHCLAEGRASVILHAPSGGGVRS